MNEDNRTLDAAMLAHLQNWTGRVETVSDVITSAPVRALSAALACIN